MAVFYAGQVATQQAGALLNVPLGHAFLQPVVSDGLADVDLGEHFRMRHSNQTGIFWQVEISAIPKPLSSYDLTGWDPGMLKQCIRNELPAPLSSGGCEERVLSHQHPAVYA